MTDIAANMAKTRQTESVNVRWSPSLIDLYLAVMMVLMPLARFKFTYGIILIDLWNLAILPFLIGHLMLTRRRVWFPYAVPMWLILLASLTSTLVAQNQLTSLVTISQDLYLFIWFTALITLLAEVKEPNLRVFIQVWLAVVIFHGLLLIAQLVSPELLRITTAFVGKYGAAGSLRAMGLFDNPNMAASFQLLGFIPLLLLRPTRFVVTPLALLVILSIIATGSLGAILGLCFGLLTIAVTTSLNERKLPVVRLVGQLTSVIATAILFVVALQAVFPDFFEDPQYGESILARIEQLSLGRMERSTETRLDLWEQAQILLSKGQFPIGIGPGNYFTTTLYQTGELHSDFVSFLIERGLIGALALTGLGIQAILRPWRWLQRNPAHRMSLGTTATIFTASALAVVLQSFSHEVFHFRFIWLALALQEAYIVRFGGSADSPSAE